MVGIALFEALKGTMKGGFNEIAAAFKKIIMEDTIKGWKKIGKVLGEKSKVLKGLFKAGKALKGVGQMAMGPLNAIMSFMDALGIAEPFLEIFSGILELIGAAAIEALTPAINTLAELFSDQAFIDALTDIGELIGLVLTPALQILAPILKIVASAIGFVSNAIKGGFDAVGEWWGNVVKMQEEALEKQRELMRTRAESALREQLAAGKTIKDFSAGQLKIIKGMLGDELYAEIFGIGKGTVKTPKQRIEDRERLVGGRNAGGDILINIRGNVVGKNAMKDMIDEIQMRRRLGLM